MLGLGNNALGAFRAIEQMVSPMAAITSATSLAGMAALEKTWASTGNTISKTGYALNMPVSKLSSLEKGMQLAGSSAGAADATVKGLNATLQAAFYRHDQGAIQTLDALGIFASDGHGNIAKTEDALDQLANKIKTYKDHGTQVRAITSVGGDADVLPALKDGAAGLHEWQKKAEATGAVWTEQMAANATKVQGSFSRLQEDLEGIGNHIANDWSGVADRVMTKTSDWIEHNQGLAKSYTELGIGITALGLLKPAVWVLRLLGLLGPTEAIAVLGAIGAGAAALPPTPDTTTLITPGGLSDNTKRQLGLPGPMLSSDDAPPESWADWFRSLFDRGTPGPRPGPISASSGYWQTHGPFAPLAPGAPGETRGIHNRNPMNLGFVGDQPGVLGREPGSDHRFGVFADMPHGIAAELRQLRMYQDSGLKTVKDLVDRWVGDPAFDSTGYVADVAKSIGVVPHDTINMRDPKTAAAYVRAAAPHESGAVSETDLAAGVNLARGQEYGGGGGQSDGTVHVTVDINHAPPGTRARATASGRATTAPPRVETPAVGL